MRYLELETVKKHCIFFWSRVHDINETAPLQDLVNYLRLYNKPPDADMLAQVPGFYDRPNKAKLMATITDLMQDETLPPIGRMKAGAALLKWIDQDGPAWEYEIRGDYGHGFECVTTETNRIAAKEQLKYYRDNETFTTFYMKKVRGYVWECWAMANTY